MSGKPRGPRCLARARTLSRAVLRWIGLASLSATLLAASAASALSGAVATEHRLGAEAGAEILRAGGTAADAAIAAATTVCVVHPSSCGPGGGGFALVHLADGQTAALDYRETAPAAATPERFGTNGQPIPALLRTGGLAVAVPGEVAGLTALHRRFGRLPLGRVLAPAIRLAREGFALGDSPHLQREIGRAAALIAADPGLRARFLDASGAVPGPAFRVVQADLAETLERVAAGGRDAFYRGPMAEAVSAAVRARGGVLAPDDLARYRPRWRQPLAAAFRGRRILAFPLPGSGAAVLTTLGILARDDPGTLGAGSPTLLHLLAAALTQAFVDRARWYGDPSYTDVPLERLLAPARLMRVRAALSAVRVPTPSDAPSPDAGTAHVSVVDGDGNAVAMTTTINTGFGAGVLVPGTGIILNNEMDDFVLAADVPNVYGLVGGAANFPAPGKRPQSSMSPTIVLRDGRPELVVGASGGPFIVSATVQTVLGVTALGLDLRSAIDAPRIHHQGVPAGLLLEPGIAAEARAALARLGHRLASVPAIGAVSAVGLRPDGEPNAFGDRRKDGGEVVCR